jgi:hypothetical protein
MSVATMVSYDRWGKTTIRKLPYVLRKGLQLVLAKKSQALRAPSSKIARLASNIWRKLNHQADRR